MNRQQTYGEPNVNPYVTSQMEHMSAQRRQPVAGMDNFPGCLSLEGQHLYKPSKLEGQGKWDRDASRVLNQMPSNSFNQGTAGQGGIGKRSHYYGQTPNSLDNPTTKKNTMQAQEQDMQIGYGDGPSPSTFERLERKFHGEIMQLVKEQSDAEDAENTRHREKMIEINTMFQEKLSAVRAQHASQREEFLRKESQSRLYQFQQAGISHYEDTGLQDDRGYIATAIVTTTGEATYRGYVPSQFESYRDQHQSVAGTSQGTEASVPCPENVINSIPGTSFTPVPSKSSQMASEILQQLNELVSTGGKTPIKLSPSMLSGSALKSLEKLDSSKFLENSQEKNKLDGLHGDKLPDIQDSMSHKHDAVEETGKTKMITPLDESVPLVNGIGTSNLIKDNVASANAPDSLVMKSVVHLPQQKKWAFQMSAHEDSLDLGDDDYHPKGASFVVEREKLDSSVVGSKNVAPEAIRVEKSFTFSETKPLTSAPLNQSPDLGAYDGSIVAEKNSSITSATANLPTTSSQPVVLASLSTSTIDKAVSGESNATSPMFSSGEKTSLSKEQNATIPTFYIGFATVNKVQSISETSGFKFDACSNSKLEESNSFESVATTANHVAKSAESDKLDDKSNLKPGFFSSAPGSAGSSAVSTSSSSSGSILSSSDSPTNKKNTMQAQEQDMEIGYRDCPSSSPSTFEGLERKFHGEIMQLVKEQSDAEDAENTRHREKMIEIYNMYQEKLSAVRAQHASQREEFLCKESQSWLYQFQQAGISQYQGTGLQDARGYTATAVVTATGEAPTFRGYVPSQFESYRDQHQYDGLSAPFATTPATQSQSASTFNVGDSRISAAGSGLQPQLRACLFNLVHLHHLHHLDWQGMHLYLLEFHHLVLQLLRHNLLVLGLHSESVLHLQLAMLLAPVVPATTSLFGSSWPAPKTPIFGSIVNSTSSPSPSPSPSGFSCGLSSTCITGGSFSLGNGVSVKSARPSGSLEFNAGGSFSLGSGGVDKSARKIVRVKGKQRKK